MLGCGTKGAYSGPQGVGQLRPDRGQLPFRLDRARGIQGDRDQAEHPVDEGALDVDSLHALEGKIQCGLPENSLANEEPVFLHPEPETQPLDGGDDEEQHQGPRDYGEQDDKAARIVPQNEDERHQRDQRTPQAAGEDPRDAAGKENDGERGRSLPVSETGRTRPTGFRGLVAAGQGFDRSGVSQLASSCSSPMSSSSSVSVPAPPARFDRVEYVVTQPAGHVVIDVRDGHGVAGQLDFEGGESLPSLER